MKGRCAKNQPGSSTVNDRGTEELEIVRSVQYTCEGMYDVHGKKMELYFPLDFSSDCDSHKAIGQQGEQAQTETMHELERLGCQAGTTCHSGRNESVLSDFLMVEKEKKVRLFDQRPHTGRNNRVTRDGTRTYLSVILVCLPRARRLAHIVAHASISKVIAEAEHLAKEEDASGALRCLKGILQRGDSESISVADYERAFETFAMIGSKASRTACRVASLFLATFPQGCTKHSHTPGPNQQFSPAVYAALVRACASTACEDLIRICEQICVLIARDTPLPAINRAFLDLCSAAVAAGMPQMEHALLQRLVTSEAKHVSSDVFFTLVERIVCEPRLWGYAEPFASRFGKVADLEALVTCLCNMQERVALQSAPSSQGVCHTSNSSSSSSREGSNNRPTSCDEGLRATAGTTSAAIYYVFLRALLSTPRLAADVLSYDCIMGKLAACVVRSEDLSLQTKLSNTVLEGLTAHKRTRALVSIRNAAICNPDDEAVLCLLGLLHVNAICANYEDVTALLGSFPEWSWQAGTRQQAHRNFATFAAGLISSLFSISPSVLTCMHALNLLEVLCQLKYAPPEVTSLVQDLSNKLCEDKFRDEAPALSSCGKSREHFLTKAAGILTCICAFYESHNMVNDMHACLVTWAAALDGPDTALMVKALDDIATKPWTTSPHTSTIAGWRDSQAAVAAAKCILKLSEDLDEPRVAAMSREQLLGLAVALVSHKVSEQSRELVLTRLLTILPALMREEKKKTLEAFFFGDVQRRAARLRAANSNAMQLVAHAYYDILIHDSDMQPPPKRCQYKLVCKSLRKIPELVRFIEDPMITKYVLPYDSVLRAATIAEMFNNQPVQRNTRFDIECDYDTEPGSLILTKVFDWRYERALDRHQHHMLIVIKLLADFPTITKGTVQHSKSQSFVQRKPVASAGDGRRVTENATSRKRERAESSTDEELTTTEKGSEKKERKI